MADYSFPMDHIPDDLDPFWIQTAYGGVSPCIAGNPQYITGATIANCVGWSWGRFQSLRDSIDTRLPTGDAGNWYQTAVNNGMDVGQDPQLGAVICFSQGHVANVEYISDDGSYICCSESDYGGSAFTYRTRYKANNYELLVGGFQGFIYNDAVNINKFKWWMAKRIIQRRRNGGYL